MQNRSLTLICERSRTPDRGDDKEEDETDPRKLELLLKEFCGKWQALPVGQVRVCLKESVCLRSRHNVAENVCVSVCDANSNFG